MNKTTEYEVLKNIINEEDPIGLVDFDTPESFNEYDPELREILKKDIFSLNRQDLGKYIYQIFVAYFNEDLAGEEEKYNRIAEKFLSVIK